MQGNSYTHIDLFSGIGGFTLACQWNDIETEVFCEKDKKCQGFLQRTYPGVHIVSDIREFDGTKWQGRFLLTAGVPCQPASRAGKQRGKDDDRWLWPEALRVVSEARPDWCLFENPLGINDVCLDGILADLEGLDYEVAPPLIIPACAVNSPQLRNRYWIVAKSNGGRSTEEYELCDSSLPSGSSEGDLADTARLRWKEGRTNNPAESQRRQSWNGIDELLPGFWSNSVWISCADGKVRRAPDDSFGVAHGIHRSVLAGLGNSIVPQVAYQIIKAIVEVENAGK